MKNMEKYTQVFVERFGKSADEVKSLEDTFDIMMETDDIIDFDSYEKGIEILKKYNVDFES